jgi:hypothetical protein
MIEGIPGLHLLEAAKERGWETIDAFFEGVRPYVHRGR